MVSTEANEDALVIEEPRVDSLVIEEHVASTSMSDVYLGHFHEGSLGLAVKIAKQKVLAKFTLQREASITPTIASSHVFPVLGSGHIHQPGTRWNGLPYIVSPFNRGGKLQDRVAVDADSAQTTIATINDAAQGLRDIHDHGYVHCDVKVGNILTAEGQGFVSDLGLAVRSGEHFGSDSREIFRGRAFGTLGYMPPEQMRGLPMTESSDVFSLGVTAVYALTGQFPWQTTEGGTSKQRLMMDVYRAIIDGDIRKLPDYVSKVVGAVLDCSLEPNPDNRPTMDEFIMWTSN